MERRTPTVRGITKLGVVVCVSWSLAGTALADCQASDFLRTIETDKQVYQLGEQVHITSRLTNVGEESCSTGVPNGGRLIAYVEDGDDVIWDPHAGMDLPGSLYRVFAPGEFHEDESLWDMTDYEGNDVGPGEYDVSWSPGSEVRTTITIVPEPCVGLFVSVGFVFLLRRNRRGP